MYHSTFEERLMEQADDSLRESKLGDTENRRLQQVQNELKVPLQEKFRRGILENVRNISSDTLKNNGMKFILQRAQ